MRAINSILEIIFPKRPDYFLVKATTVEEMKNLYQPEVTADWTALASFKEQRIRAAIHETKFHQNDTAIRLLAELLKLHLNNRQEVAILIPVPLSVRRRYQRRYNQVTKVAKIALKGQSSVILHNWVLLKIWDTKPQTSLDKAARQQNVTGAYVANYLTARKIAGQHVILLDDVVTTGATFKAAKAALQKYHPASITCLALAH